MASKFFVRIKPANILITGCLNICNCCFGGAQKLEPKLCYQIICCFSPDSRNSNVCRTKPCMCSHDLACVTFLNSYPISISFTSLIDRLFHCSLNKLVMSLAQGPLQILFTLSGMLFSQHSLKTGSLSLSLLKRLLFIEAFPRYLT